MIEISEKAILAAKEYFFVHGLGYSECSTERDVIGLILDLTSEIHRASGITPDKISLPGCEHVMSFLEDFQDKEE